MSSDLPTEGSSAKIRGETWPMHAEPLSQFLQELGDVLLVAYREGKSGVPAQDFVIREVNPAVEKVFGFVPDEVIGKSLYEWGKMTYLEPRFVNARVGLLDEVIETRQVVALQEERRTKNGKSVFVGVHVFFCQEAPREKVTLHYRDLSYQWKLEKLLRKAERIRVAKEVMLEARLKAELAEAAALFSSQEPPRRERHILNEDVNLALSLMTRRLGEKGVAVAVDLDPANALVNTSRAEVVHALINVLQNAVDALEGRPHARIKITTQSTPSRTLVFIEDNGPGIPIDHAGRVFEPFFTSREERAGLGLTVAYEIVKNCGGDLRVDTDVGKGARFVMELPLVKPVVAGEAKKVLVLDDEPSIIALLQRYLRTKGYFVQSASDGRVGVQMAAREQPDIVLLDIMLPGKDGLEVLSEIKTRNPDTVVIMISGVESEVVAKRALEMGAYSYITKPLDLDTVGRRLEEVAEAKSLASAAGKGGTETLLVVDDDEPVRSYMAQLLKQSGYTVLSAAGAKEALRLYLENKERINLVSVDLLMPEMSGHNLMQTLLRMNPGLKILVISGAAFEGKLDTALGAGAQAVLEKPFAPEQLLGVVREILDRD